MRIFHDLLRKEQAGTLTNKELEKLKQIRSWKKISEREVWMKRLHELTSKSIAGSISSEEDKEHRELWARNNAVIDWDRIEGLYAKEQANTLTKDERKELARRRAPHRAMTVR